MLLSAVRNIDDAVYIFQQDGAPADRGRQTVRLFRGETPEFTAPDMYVCGRPTVRLITALGSYAETILPYDTVRRGRFAADVDDCSRRSY